MFKPGEDSRHGIDSMQGVGRWSLVTQCVSVCLSVCLCIGITLGGGHECVGVCFWEAMCVMCMFSFPTFTPGMWVICL